MNKTKNEQFMILMLNNYYLINIYFRCNKNNLIFKD